MKCKLTIFLISFIFLYIDFSPNFDFRNELSAFFNIKIEDGKRKKKQYNFDDLNFNIITIEL